MRNEKIFSSWSKIKPDNATHERILGGILDRVHSNEYKKGKVKNMIKKPYWKILAPIAACLIIAVAVTVPTLLKNNGNDPSNSFILNRSSGNIQVRYVDYTPNMPSTSASLAYMTEEELITLNNTDIFSGTIQSVHNLEIDFNGDILYKGLTTIIVDEVFRGSYVTGDVASILLDNTFNANVWVADNDVTEQFAVGMTGIFMPVHYDDTSPYSYQERNGAEICWLDIAQCRFNDGSRYAFLEAEDGLIFARWAYESIANATTLDEVRQYVIGRVDIDTYIEKQIAVYKTENALLSLNEGNRFALSGPLEISYMPNGAYSVEGDVMKLFIENEEAFRFLLVGDTLIFESGEWLENWVEPGTVFILVESE